MNAYHWISASLLGLAMLLYPTSRVIANNKVPPPFEGVWEVGSCETAEGVQDGNVICGRFQATRGGTDETNTGDLIGAALSKDEAAVTLHRSDVFQSHRFRLTIHKSELHFREVVEASRHPLLFQNLILRRQVGKEAPDKLHKVRQYCFHRA